MRFRWLFLVLPLGAACVGVDGVREPETSEASFLPQDVCASVVREAGGLAVSWCVESLVRDSRGNLEAHMKWEGWNLRGPIYKESDSANRRMYLIDTAGNRYDHIATRGAAADGGRLEPGRSEIRGVFVFPPPSAGQIELWFFDADVGSILPLTLEPAARAAPLPRPSPRLELGLGAPESVARARKVLEDGDWDAFATWGVSDRLERDIDFRFEDGETLLSLAAARGRADAVSWLLERGANPNVSTPGGTPLHVAAAHGHAEVVRRLIDGGADPGAENALGLTPLEVARAAGHRGVDQRLSRLPPAGRELGLRIHEAAVRGDAVALRQMLPRATDVEGADWDGVTALMSAVQNGHLEATRLLVQAGADIDVRAGSGVTPLYWAVFNNHIDILDLLLDSGAAAKATTADGSTLLMVARSGEAVAALVRAGADIHAVDERGNTALMRQLHGGARYRSYSSENYRPGAPLGDVGPIDGLLAAGVDVNAANTFGQTALFLAVAPYIASPDIELVRRLIAAGADANAKANDGKTPLFYAVSKKLGSIRPRTPSMELIELLISAGADPLARDVNGDDVFTFAVREGSIEVQRLLAPHFDVPLDMVSDPELASARNRGQTIEAHRDATLQSALLDALERGSVDGARELMGRGANLRDVALRESLITHLTAGDEAALMAYAELGGDVDSPDAWGRIPLELSITYGWSRATLTLLHDGAVLDRARASRLLPAVVLLGDVELLDMFLTSHGGGTELATRALLVAAGSVSAPKAPARRSGGARAGGRRRARVDTARRPDYAMMELLLGAGAKTEPALFALVGGGDADACRWLLQRGVSPDANLTAGRTPLSLAAETGQIEIAKVFIEHGAELDTRDALGKTPLMWAAFRGRDELVRLLLRAGAASELRDGAGATALVIARQMQHESTAAILMTWPRP